MAKTIHKEQHKLHEPIRRENNGKELSERPWDIWSWC